MSSTRVQKRRAAIGIKVGRNRCGRQHQDMWVIEFPVLIHGTISFPRGTKPIGNATVRIRLEDARTADAPAPILAELIIPDVDFSSTEQPGVPFVLKTSMPPPIGCSIRVLIDVDGDGAVSKGDYISKISSPVDLSQTPITICVSPVD